MKFKVGDKVIMNEYILADSGLGNLKIKKGYITKINYPFIHVQRGKENAVWNMDFWRRIR